MNKQLYRMMDEGERIQEGDVIFNRQHEAWCGISSLECSPVALTGWLRPVSIERVTGTESAFPAFDGSGVVGGMTLREHYAGLAMQGILASRKVSGDGVFPWEEIAPSSVQMADALIAALNKKEEAA